MSNLVQTQVAFYVLSELYRIACISKIVLGSSSFLSKYVIIFTWFTRICHDEMRPQCLSLILVRLHLHDRPRCCCVGSNEYISLPYYPEWTVHVLCVCCVMAWGGQVNCNLNVATRNWLNASSFGRPDADFGNRTPNYFFADSVVVSFFITDNDLLVSTSESTWIRITVLMVLWRHNPIECRCSWVSRQQAVPLGLYNITTLLEQVFQKYYSCSCSIWQ